MKIILNSKLNTIITCLIVLNILSISLIGQSNRTMTYRTDSVEVITIIEGMYYPTYIDNLGDNVILQEFGSSESSMLWNIDDGISIINGKAISTPINGNVYGDYTNTNFPNHEGEPIVNAGFYSIDNVTWSFLGLFPGYNDPSGEDYNSAWGVSDDGNTVVGLQYDDSWSAFAFKWTSDDGYVNLSEGLSGNSRASGISRNGEVIYGYYSMENGMWSPIIWKNNQQIKLSPGSGGEVLSASANGTYVAGTSDTAAFIWSEKEGFVPFAYADHLTTTVLETGEAFGFSGMVPFERVAFYKDTLNNVIPFAEYASQRGMKDADQWIFNSITGATPDGNTFMGTGISPDGIDICFLIKFIEIENNISDIESDNIIVYPNPASNKIIIQDVVKGSIINIYDLKGNHVLSTVASNISKEININELSKGSYIIEVLNNDIITREKFIKL